MSDSPTQPAARPVVGFVLLAVVAVASAASIPWLRSERESLQREATALRATQATAAQRLDSLRQLAASVTATLTLERARATARDEPKLHLVIAVDSGTVALMRDGITLRAMPARFRGGLPARGQQTIAKIAESIVAATAPTVDSLGNTITAATPELKVDRVTLSDGTTFEGGDAAAALLGGVDDAPGPRVIVVSRRDFAAIRPNLVRGMKAVLF
jgi:glucose/arabinose dehydrogenase